jgi:hypothetical protein
VTTPPPYDKWKLRRFTDTRENKEISDVAAIKRLMREVK